MTGGPRISIVTPVGDGGPSLRRTLESVAAQEHGDVEHLLVGDGAPADSPRARPVAGPGAPRGAAINAGFRAATGAILGTLDAGDVLLPGALARVAREVDPARGRHAVLGRCRVVDAAGQWVGIEHARPLDPPRRLLEIWRGQPIAAPAAFYTADAWRASGPMDEGQGPAAGAYDFFCRLSRSCAIASIDQPLVAVPADAAWALAPGDMDAAIAVSRRYWGSPLRPDYWALALSLGRFRLDRTGRGRRYLRMARECWPRAGAWGAAAAGVALAPDVAFSLAVYPSLREVMRHVWGGLMARVEALGSVPPETTVYLGHSEAWSDGWVGPRLAVSCAVAEPAGAVGVSGWVDLRPIDKPFVLTVRVDGRVVGYHRVREGGDFLAHFPLDTPLPPGTYTVDVEASAWFVPDRVARTGDFRPLAWRFGSVELHGPDSR